MNAREWLDAFAAKIGTDRPTAAEFSTLLDLASEAAHSSERVAAPVACWLAARADVAPEEALAIARDLSPNES